ncbi:MAG: copper chaperone PCu(A)C [Aestuariibacter sp.]
MKSKMFALAILLCATIAQASEDKLHMMSAWAPATFKLAVNGAAYINAHNMSGQDVAIAGLSVDEKIASRVELHETIIKDDMARMRQITLPVTIPAGEALSMQPGGKHIMLLGLASPLSKGVEFPLTLHFEDGTEQVVNVSIDAQAEATDHSHHH